MNNLTPLMSNIESLLFVIGEDGLTLHQLAQLTDSEPLDVQKSLSELMARYNNDDTRGIMLKELAGTYQLVSKPTNAAVIEKLVENPPVQSLSQAALEVLAIIAYKQPITRVEIEDLRGVKCERPLHTLNQKLLIQEIGRVEGTGRAILYGTTSEFLNYFGLNRVEDLPPLEVEEFELDEEQDLFMSKFQEAFTQTK
ncbi:SMC-Scp complex subunit ScpB [Kurthia huakuii]|uniref:SMC-Scp complex subunit ScpB n=1 Tax=Kurthia huakuii TaxID=1421019 RepID=UPI0004961D2B|nr:SMC-Scp complex subunit ScpB [Kurthia huakuii]MBM7698996.1 segregation and condensation protein B [Kurthia huakuii]